MKKLLCIRCKVLVNAHCQSRTVLEGVNITVSPGIYLTIYRKDEEAIPGGQKKGKW